ncbi:MAG: HAMP domain-containing sensor histidine kinase, partial [Crocinitomicaceae bacterium]|nr:HAMP domain-containing sensor histidine kinase [Crocinitomicaceae bacterium]
ADAIKKRIELVELTDSTFIALREKERDRMELWVNATKEVSAATSNLDADLNIDFPMSLINANDGIPVIALDDEGNISSARNVDFDSTAFAKEHNELAEKEVFKLIDDTLLKLSQEWAKVNPSFTVDIYQGLYFMTYVYTDSKQIVRYERKRDSLIQRFNEDLVNNKGLVPVLLVDDEQKEVLATNIPNFDASKIDSKIADLASQNTRITLNFQNEGQSFLYFGDSPELKQLQYFPYIQFTVIGLFAIIAYLIFSTFRKAEQNQVWAGMAKESAHQLGTPLSSLMAWIQLLEAQGVDQMALTEMQKDIDRLEKVTDRFSKIGSETKLKDDNISSTIINVVEYLRPRISDKVEFTLDAPDEILHAKHNASLIEWVVENICKNAVDAMEAEGKLHVHLKGSPEWIHIDIKDTGKGIPANQQKNIFEPGYSTKKRGWGLGLSLVKRIVKEYHKGRVYVLESRVDVGTTFRISIPTK